MHLNNTDNPDELFNHIKSILGASPESMKILEDSISIDVQMEYYKMVSKIRSAETLKTFIADDLLNLNLSNDEVKEYLIHLAGSDDVENYRLIEQYVSIAPPELKEWALMALNESHFHMVSSLSDENGVFISTGLGGKSDKLRYFIVFVPSNDGLNAEQKQLVVDEANFIFPRYNSEIEKIEILDDFVCVTVLIPLDVAVNEPIKEVIAECLSLGCSLNDGYIVTNVKQLSLEEIRKIINREPIEGMDFDDE
jgi:hypothetical protein